MSPASAFTVSACFSWSSALGFGPGLLSTGLFRLRMARRGKPHGRMARPRAGIASAFPLLAGADFPSLQYEIHFQRPLAHCSPRVVRSGRLVRLVTAGITNHGSAAVYTREIDSKHSCRSRLPIRKILRRISGGTGGVRDECSNREQDGCLLSEVTEKAGARAMSVSSYGWQGPSGSLSMGEKSDGLHIIWR